MPRKGKRERSAGRVKELSLGNIRTQERGRKKKEHVGGKQASRRQTDLSDIAHNKLRSLSDDEHDKFCFMCQNGGSSVACDDCPRVLCTEHIAEFSSIPTGRLDKMVFECPSCYIYGQEKAGAQPVPYQGFYDVMDGTRMAYIQGGLTLSVPYSFGQHARVNTRPVAVVHLHLESLADSGSVARVVYESMKEYFVEEQSKRLRYFDIPYNLNNNVQGLRHQAKITKELSYLRNERSARVLVFIYTHSHSQTGMLYYGNDVAAQSLTNWFDVLLPEDVRALFRMHTTSVFMLCCGALVKTPAALAALRSNFASLRIPRLLAFEAAAFQAAHTIPFFVTFVEKIIFENVNFSDVQMSNLLAHSLNLRRHSKVIMMSSSHHDEARIVTTEYSWSHRSIRPHGELLPVQCPSCKGLFCFETTQKRGTTTLVTKCTRPACAYVKETEKCAGQQVLGGAEGTWLKRVLE
ncbi:hypothetical protein OH77DRAFT_1592597 [Trametes cingulata]|nr:hypothetical protein OH77DRAFT_1592597 [Trametes cingulata]